MLPTLLSRYTQRELWRGIAVSLCAHVAVGALLYVLAERREDASAQDEDSFLLGVDFDLAPVPPEPFEPVAEPESPPPPEPTRAAPEPEPEPEPEPKPEPETAAASAQDAGVDAAPLAKEQAQPTGLDAGVAGDAETAIASTNPVAGDAGPAEGSKNVFDPRGTDEPDIESSMPPGASADLRPYLPRGEVLAVQIRFDRLRGTPWAKRVDAVLAPMPDYRMIIGKRDRLLADLFDMLLIASSDPNNVTKTHLAAYTETMTPKQLREFLDHEDAHVRWSMARGGALGLREPSSLSQPDDPRVYLMPFSGWTLLARRQFLREMTKPSTADIDGAFPDPKDFPPWLAKVPSLREQSGGESKDGPIVVASFHSRRERLDVPMVGELPAPERMSVALQLASTGFLLQGTMVFRSENAAAEFEATVKDGLARMTGTKVGRSLLAQVHALNTAKGLTLRRRGQRMSFVSSFSTADGKAMCEAAAQITERFYRGLRGGNGAD
jgi:hypothetical protein